MVASITTACQQGVYQGKCNYPLSGNNLSTWGSERLRLLLKVTQLEMSLVLSLPDPGWRPDRPPSQVPFIQLHEPYSLGRKDLEEKYEGLFKKKPFLHQSTFELSKVTSVSRHIITIPTWEGDRRCNSPLPHWWNHTAAPGRSLSSPCLPAYVPSEETGLSPLLMLDARYLLSDSCNQPYHWLSFRVNVIGQNLTASPSHGFSIQAVLKPEHTRSLYSAWAVPNN